MQNKSIKDKLYNYFVRKNDSVQYEYERYVREHIEEHRLHKWIHIKLLIKLNWHYRIKKNKTPYIYFDDLTKKMNEKSDCSENNKSSKVRKTKVESTGLLENYEQIEANNTGWKSNAYIGSESRSYTSWKAVHLVKRFLEYDYIVFDAFHTLIYFGIRNDKAFYQILEEEFQISRFGELRERAEIEARSKARHWGKEVTIKNIYQQLKKYTNIDVNEGVKKEIQILKKISYPNAFVKNFYEMLSYNEKNIAVIQNTYYSSEQIREILEANGYNRFSFIFVSNEKCSIKDDGNMFPIVTNKLAFDKIIYMGYEKKKNELAKQNGWNIWEYRNATDIGDKYRPIGLVGTNTDSYCAIVNQHLYCGQYQNSQRRELGYIYFGVVIVGFLNWIREQCQMDYISRLEFIYGTSDILQNNFNDFFIENEIKSDVLLFSEEIAVRCLVDIEPSIFYDYYIDRKVKGNFTVSFYLEKMGIYNIKERLKAYGISPTDIVKKNGDVYWAFLDFIGDNLPYIKAQYENEILAVCQYLQEKNFTAERIGVVNIKGKGYIGKALNWLLKEKLNIDCQVIELTAFQMMPFEDIAYKSGAVKAYVSAKENVISGLEFPINIGQGNYIESVFSDKKPRLCSFCLCENKQFNFIFDDAYPWRYAAINEIQKGMQEFVNDYMNIWKNDFEMCSFSAEDIILILRNIMGNYDYLKTTIPIILI